MGIIAFLILGGVAGWIASLIMHTDAQQGILLNVVMGVIGAVLGGVVFNALGSSGVTGFNLYSLVVATIGAVVFIWILKAIRGA